MPHTFYEFFAGGGMAHLGLGDDWTCLFANDIDTKKAASYKAHFNDPDYLVVDDIAKVKASQLPGHADLAWASFPCQDLSLAGNGAGLKGARSGMFWAFWELMEGLREDGRAPQTIIIENVVGAITSHDGKDLAAILKCLADGGYHFGPIVIDAALFLPQSRPRLFIVATRSGAPIPEHLLACGPRKHWHPDSFDQVYDQLPEYAREKWLWWSLPTPERRRDALIDVVEDDPQGVAWHTPFETKKLLDMMSPINLDKVKNARKAKIRVVGTLYKRTRMVDGVKRQRAEVRFDDVAGCLRTPGGGSSRQTILVIDDGKVKSRLLSPREVVRLMGMPDTYPLPAKYNDAYHLAGDGVVVPVVRFLAEHLLQPLLGMAAAVTELQAEG